jgi:hypothetical protein
MEEGAVKYAFLDFLRWLETSAWIKDNLLEGNIMENEPMFRKGRQTQETYGG